MMFSGIYLDPSIECSFSSGTRIDEARQARIGNGLLPVGSALSEWLLAGVDELTFI